MFGETQAAINHRAERMTRTGGAHAVFLAALEDPKLAKRLASSPSGALRYQGRPLGPRGMASILVYLTGKYSIRPSEFELRCGLLSASERGGSNNSVLQEDQVRREVIVKRRIEAWIEERGNPHLFTTAELAADVLPEDMQTSQRSSQMIIARLLKSLGYIKRRRKFGGARQFVWMAPPFVADTEVDVAVDALAQKKYESHAVNRDEVLEEPLEEPLPDLDLEPEEEPEDIDPLEVFDDEVSFREPEHATPFDDHEDLEDADDLADSA